MNIKQTFLTLLFAFSALCGVAQTGKVYYGYSPATTPDGTEISGLGSGKNGFLSTAFCLDPAADPVVQRLKGKKIVGVRCYLRTAYEQEFDEWSYVQVIQGDLTTAKPVRKYVDFAEGWNDVYFDSPVTIGSEKLYVGYGVNELRGSAYPVVAYNSVSVPGSCWMKLGSDGTWTEYTDRGTPLIQAILEDDAAADVAHTAYAYVASAPLTIQPSVPVTMQVYVHNQSAETVRSLVVEAKGDGDVEAHPVEVALASPLAAYDGRVVALSVTPGAAEGPAQTLSLTVSQLNGVAAQAGLPGTSTHYVTRDAFVRIPLMEEFTEQKCPNCPYLAYYLDQAREVYGKPNLYVAHHAGFNNKDAFTTQADKDLLYLFGDQNTFNPAITYNRSYLTGQNYPVMAAHGEPTYTNYLNDIVEAANQPAMAKVLVDADMTGGKLRCTVHGAVNRQIVANGTPVYLTTYFVQDSITTAEYIQDGLDADDAPADLVERFRHNGVVRKQLSTANLGDRLSFADDATFSVTYPEVDIADTWKTENMQVIAFVHYYDASNLRNNSVLNAGGNRTNAYVTGIQQASTVSRPDATVLAYSTADRRLHTSSRVDRMEAYTVGGQRVNTGLPLAPGIYLVQLTVDGTPQRAQKVMVR